MTGGGTAATLRAMSHQETIRIPPGGLSFAAPVCLAAADGSTRRFAGVAYAGGVITDHPFWSAVAFDLAGLQAASQMPVLLQHNQEAVIGVAVDVHNDGSQLDVGGKLFTGIEPKADSVAAKADAGAQWQMSVGIFPRSIEEVSAGSAILLNGRQVNGPLTVFRSAQVREISFVALGADGATRANVFNGGDSIEVPVFRNTKGDPDMSDQNDVAAALAAMTAERDAERARADEATTELVALREQFAARSRAEREAAVRTFLGDAFSAEAAAPYLSMTAEQFAAVQSTFAAMRSKLPPGFTVEQASGGSRGGSSITPEAIVKYRRDNPGASYEQAFAALTSAA